MLRARATSYAIAPIGTCQGNCQPVKAWRFLRPGRNRALGPAGSPCTMRGTARPLVHARHWATGKLLAVAHTYEIAGRRPGPCYLRPQGDHLDGHRPACGSWRRCYLNYRHAPGCRATALLPIEVRICRDRHKIKTTPSITRLRATSTSVFALAKRARAPMLRNKFSGTTQRSSHSRLAPNARSNSTGGDIHVDQHRCVNRRHRRHRLCPL